MHFQPCSSNKTIFSNWPFEDLKHYLIQMTIHFLSSPCNSLRHFQLSKIFSKYGWTIILIANIYWVSIICLILSPSCMSNNCSFQQHYGGWCYSYFYFIEGKTEEIQGKWLSLGHIIENFKPKCRFRGMPSIT